MSKPITIAVVDDSTIIRAMIAKRLSEVEGISVVATYANGQIAVNSLRTQPVDIVVLDIEMPVMDGLSALPEILKVCPQARVIMASTLTQQNAETSLKAMRLGAVDYIPKPSIREDRAAAENFYRDLIQKIRAIAPVGRLAATAQPQLADAKASPSMSGLSGMGKAQIPATATFPKLRPKALAIASSTGGPQALLTLFRDVKDGLRDVPVFITQHMPPTFTTILAQHISQAGGVDCHEAKQGEQVKPGIVYLAPGGFHMIPKWEGSFASLQLDNGPEVNYCRPAADPMIDALTSIYGKDLMLLVLTGMGYDGLNAARKLKDRGGFVAAQDEQSSVVWGMPGAVATHGLCGAVLPLPKIAAYLLQVFGK